MQLVKTKKESLLEKSFVKRNDGKKKRSFRCSKDLYHNLDKDSSAQIFVGPVWVRFVEQGALVCRWHFFSTDSSGTLQTAQFALSLCLSQWSSAIPSINGGGEVRWLPRFSQPVQCKDRKSQGSTPLTTPIKQHCHVTHKAVKKMKMMVPSQ